MHLPELVGRVAVGRKSGGFSRVEGGNRSLRRKLKEKHYLDRASLSTFEGIGNYPSKREGRRRDNPRYQSADTAIQIPKRDFHSRLTETKKTCLPPPK